MKHSYPVIDYAKRRDKRQVLTNFLRTGPFSQISGHVMKGRRIRRRRVAVTIIAVLFFCIGLYGVFR